MEEYKVANDYTITSVIAVWSAQTNSFSCTVGHEMNLSFKCFKIIIIFDHIVFPMACTDKDPLKPCV